MDDSILQQLIELLVRHYSDLYSYQLTGEEIGIVEILVEEGYLGTTDYKIERIK